MSLIMSQLRKLPRCHMFTGKIELKVEGKKRKTIQRSIWEGKEKPVIKTCP